MIFQLCYDESKDVGIPDLMCMYSHDVDKVEGRLARSLSQRLRVFEVDVLFCAETG